TFTHKPLDHTKQTIRLIRILPDRSSSGFIQCDIYHATIEAEYVCLSYMWGPPEPSQTILMNGKYHQIGPNLFDFLNVAREKYRSERLWIDALCIDQANTAERNHQVQQMGQIYSEAQKVIIWLGKEDGLDPISRSKYAGRPTWDMVFKFSIPRYWESVFCNAYWTRAWVAQEILLARRRIILLNTTQIPWEKLVHFAGRNLRGRRNEYEQLFGAIRHVAAGKKSLSLIELLFRFRQQECKVPRDRVFSLLSLCSEGKQLRAVYDLPERDLLFQILDCYK
ncbi:HET-domain-containing protein, partial [Trematosphaeria pertusa]